MRPRGAVTVIAPSLRAASGRSGRETITVQLRVDPAKLPAWTLDGGALGGNGDAAERPRVRRLPHADRGQREAVVPWHVLPRKAADTEQPRWCSAQAGPAASSCCNVGAAASDFDVFSLTGTSKKHHRAPSCPGRATTSPWSTCVRSACATCRQLTATTAAVRDQHLRSARAPELPGGVRHLHRHQPRRRGRLRRLQRRAAAASAPPARTWSTSPNLTPPARPRRTSTPMPT